MTWLDKNICLLITTILMLSPAAYAASVSVSSSASANNGTAIVHSEVEASNGGKIEMRSSTTANNNTVVSNYVATSSGSESNIKINSNAGSDTGSIPENIVVVTKNKIYGIVTIILPKQSSSENTNGNVGNFNAVMQSPVSDVLVPVEYNISRGGITHTQAENVNFPDHQQKNGFWEWLFGFF